MGKTAFWRHLLVLTAYLLLTLAMTWPVASHLSSFVAGTGGDPWQTLWRFEDKAGAWQSAAQENQLGTFIRNEFFGGGEPRLVNLSVWPWMFLYAAFGTVTTYNLVWLLSFILSGYAIYLLTSAWREPSESRTLVGELPAFLAGVFYMFLPYHVAHAQGHFGAMQVQWIPFILLTALSLYRSFTWWKVILLWLLLTVQAWTEHHYLLWLGIGVVVCALYFHREAIAYLRSRSHLTAIGVLILLSIVTIGFSYYPTAQLAGADDSLELGITQTIRFSSDLFSFVVPAPFHWLWGEMFNQLFSQYFTGNAAEATQFLGWVPLLLILFFHQGIPKGHKRFWLVIGSVFLLIALGPRLHVFGRVLSIPLPYTLIDGLPVFSSVRAVGRAGVMVGLSAAMLLFWVLKNNLHRVGSGAVVLVLLILEFLFAPVSLQATTLSPAYEMAAQASGKSIIEIPAATNYTIASRALYASGHHGKEVLGNIALERAQSPDEFLLVKSVPAVRQLLYLRTTDLRRDRSEFFAQSLPEALPDALKFFDVGAIIVHIDSLTVLQLSAIRGFLEEDVGLTPQLLDDVIYYEVNQASIKAAHDGVLLQRDTRWQAVGLDTKRGHVYGEIDPEAAVILINVGNEVRQVTLNVTVAPESPAALTIKPSSGDSRRVDIGTQGSITVLVAPGETQVLFAGEGGKAIIQDPQLIVK